MTQDRDRSSPSRRARRRCCTRPRTGASTIRKLCGAPRPAA
jgi:hypothetical protein